MYTYTKGNRCVTCCTIFHNPSLISNLIIVNYMYLHICTLGRVGIHHMPLYGHQEPHHVTNEHSLVYKKSQLSEAFTETVLVLMNKFSLAFYQRLAKFNLENKITSS